MIARRLDEQVSPAHVAGSVGRRKRLHCRLRLRGVMHVEDDKRKDPSTEAVKDGDERPFVDGLFQELRNIIATRSGDIPAAQTIKIDELIRELQASYLGKSLDESEAAPTEQWFIENLFLRDLGASEDHVRALASARIMRAVERSLPAAPARILWTAALSRTDYGALSTFITSLPPSGADPDPDPLAASDARVPQHQKMLLDRAGECLTAQALQDLLNVPRALIEVRRKSGRILALPKASDWAYPALQFVDGKLDPLMEDVLVACREHGPWVTLDILLAPDTALDGRRLLDAVKEGDHAAVARYVAQMEGDGFA
nr:hypothetical protein [Paracoccus saliphilus]